MLIVANPETIGDTFLDAGADVDGKIYQLGLL
jgi:hypothetical protein